MRNTYFDFVKFIALIGVILIHCRFPGAFGMYLQALCSFAVPVFFCVSGYFSYNDSSDDLKRKISRMTKYVFVSNAFYLVWDIWYEYVSGCSVKAFIQYVFSIKRILVFAVTNESAIRGHLWFLGALLYCYIFVYLIKKTKNEHLIKIIMVVLFVLGYLGQIILMANGKEDKLLTYIRNWLFEGLPFFLIGYNISGARNKKALSKIKIQKNILALLCCCFVVEVLIVGSGYVYYLSVLPIVIITVLLAQGAGSPNAIIVAAASISRKYGLYIYIIQVAVIKSADLIIKDSLLYNWLRPVLVFGVTLFLAYLVVHINQKIKIDRRVRK